MRILLIIFLLTSMTSSFCFAGWRDPNPNDFIRPAKDTRNRKPENFAFSHQQVESAQVKSKSRGFKKILRKICKIWCIPITAGVSTYALLKASKAHPADYYDSFDLKTAESEFLYLQSIVQQMEEGTNKLDTVLYISTGSIFEDNSELSEEFARLQFVNKKSIISQEQTEIFSFLGEPLGDGTLTGYFVSESEGFEKLMSYSVEVALDYISTDLKLYRWVITVSQNYRLASTLLSSTSETIKY